MAHLTKMRARSVRGLPRSWPDLSIAERGIVICGDNGVGKSSIVDALEHALTGDSTLYPTKRLGVSWDKGAPDVRDGDPNVWVELQTSVGPARIAADTRLQDLPEEAQRWLARARKSSFVLRRHMLVEFVNCEPSKRYSRLEPFLNLLTYSDVENALKLWYDELNTLLSSIETGKLQLEGHLRSTFEIPPHLEINEGQLFSALNRQLEALSLQNCSDVADLPQVRDSFEAQLGGEAISHRLAKLGALKNALDRAALPNTLTPLVQTLKQAAHSLEMARASLGRQILEDWLRRGRTIIESWLTEECPLCEQPIDARRLLARLDVRIEQERTVADARRLVTERRHGLLAPAVSMQQQIQSLCTIWRDLFGNIPRDYDDAQALLGEIAALAGADDLQIAELERLEARVAASLASHSAAVDKIQAEILAEGGGDRRTGLLKARSMLDSLIGDSPRYRAMRLKRRRAINHFHIVGKLHGHAVDARKKAVQGALDRVAGLANEFYTVIHPGENIGNSSLKIRQATNRSADITTLFDGKVEHPLLHYSESHLDTLGICYFLAFRRQEADNYREFRLMIMDDVLHSVDAAHRVRFARLLKTSFSDHQLIVTTHDQILFDRLRRELGGACTFSRIIGWDIALGPQFAKFGTDLEKLILGDPKDVQPEDVAASAGRLLEGVLRTLAERLEITGPLKFEKPYTIGDIWPPLCKAFKKQKGFESNKPGLVESLDSTYWVRNACGAHANEPASPVTNREIFEFRDALTDFVGATLCSGCNEAISKRRNDDWKCECGLLHYERNLNSTEGKASPPQRDMFSLPRRLP